MLVLVASAQIQSPVHWSYSARKIKTVATGSLTEKQYVLKAKALKKVAITLEYFQLEGEASLRFDLGDAQKLDYRATAEV